MVGKVLALLSLFLSGTGMATAQDISVRGSVMSSEDGSPVAGASVLIKGTTTGTFTDSDGNFFFSSASSSGTLVVSFIGMLSKEVPVASTVKVVLDPDTRSLDEVMVIAYGSIRRSAFTGSATAVDEEQLKTPAMSIDKALAGQVAGVQVLSNSGQPGSATSIRVRGAGSLTASNEPLYVIDGVALGVGDAADYSYLAWSHDSSSNPLATLNPNDIESITVLKDAAAAALYGSRAANGVVLVTTKSGKTGKASVSFNAQYSWASLSKAYEFMNSAEYYRTIFNAYIDSGSSVEEANERTQGTITHNPYNVDQPLDANGNVVNGARIVVDTDWQNEIFSTALTRDYSINVGGANDRTDYFLSAGYTDQGGIAPAAAYKRYSGKANVSSKVNGWLKLGMNTTFSYSVQNTTIGGSAGASPMFNALNFPNGVPVYIVDKEGNPVPDANGDKQYNYSNPCNRDFNPLSIPYLDVERSKFYRALISAYAEIDFCRDLQFKTVFSPDYLATDEHQYWNKEHGNGPSYNGRLDKYHRVNLGYTSTSTLNYHHTFNLHNLNVLAGMEYWQSTFEHLYAGGRNLLGKMQELSAAGGSFSPESNTTKETMISYFGRAEYSFADRYNFSASLRSDGSSVFGDNNKWGTFWSIGANWRINQENFMKDRTAVDDLKIRASYGTSGNKAGLKRYSSLGLWEAKADYKYGTGTGVGHTQLANANLGWEKQSMFNIGVDFGFWNRLFGRAAVRLSPRSLQWFHLDHAQLCGDFQQRSRNRPRRTCSQRRDQMGLRIQCVMHPRQNRGPQRCGLCSDDRLPENLECGREPVRVLHADLGRSES